MFGRGKRNRRHSSLDADFVIVGAGSAGCVLAARLSEDPGTKVLLLEAGGRDWNPWIHVPVGFRYTHLNPHLTWSLETEPVPGLGGRSVLWPRGRVLGGTSSINGLIYIRGQREDFDRWRAMGNVGWSFDDMLPFFKATENQERGADAYHGIGGSISVSDCRDAHPLHDALIRAAEDAGYPYNPDFNGATQEGVGRYQVTIDGRRRSSAATGYLHPAMRRPNLRVETGAVVKRLTTYAGGIRGVSFTQAGVELHAMAQREVILAAGSTNSPQILQLSGIGPADLLRRFDIPVLRDVPAVGDNLQDHLGARLYYSCRNVVTYNEIAHSFPRKVLEFLKYLLRRQGALMTGAGPVGLFTRSAPDIKSPDLQYQLFAGSVKPETSEPDDQPGFMITCKPGRPESRGWIRIKSPDPSIPPAVQPNYLAAEWDRKVFLAGFRVARAICASETLKYLQVEEITPGRDVADDAGLLAYLSRTAVSTYHPTSTCIMSADPTGVVDNCLKVHGIDRLRVVDASIMPTVISGNTNATVFAIAEKAAALIRRERIP